MTLDDFLVVLQSNRRRLARMWPQTRETLAPRTDAEATRLQTEWNALVFVQRTIEARLAYALRSKFGASVSTQPESPLLGVFAGLPGDPGLGQRPPAGDPRFEVPALDVERELPLVGAESVRVAGWVLVVGAFIVTLGLVLGVLKVTGAMSAIERFFARGMAYATSLGQYVAYAAASAASGQPIRPPAPPPAPPPGPKPSNWVDTAIIAGAAILGAVLILPRLLPGPRAAGG